MLALAVLFSRGKHGVACPHIRRAGQLRLFYTGKHTPHTLIFVNSFKGSVGLDAGEEAMPGASEVTDVGMRHWFKPSGSV